MSWQNIYLYLEMRMCISLLKLSKDWCNKYTSDPSKYVGD